ncbi:hypothetical protein [Priestia aryabhattai]|uniref:hypothetical protein n=1 Tax=Priestia aryabhattai TaxID=412384 RepID=UPI00217515CD|nr:hypothetical protein [Priestia aryabhattai]
MSTPFSNVYSYFMPKIEDYNFLQLNKEDLEIILEPLLLTSIIKFKKCKKDLSKRDNVNKSFVEDLSDEETNILAQLMTVEYLTPKLLTADLVEQQVSTNEYKTYSQANHIKEIKSLRDMMQYEASKLITSYTYSENKMSDFR